MAQCPPNNPNMGSNITYQQNNSTSAPHVIHVAPSAPSAGGLQPGLQQLQPGIPPFNPALAPVPVMQQSVVANWTCDYVPQPGQFTTGLCSCCTPNFGTCCYGFWCVSCLFGDLTQNFTATDGACCSGRWWPACCGHFWLGGVFSIAAASSLFVGLVIPFPSFFQCFLTCPARQTIRTKWQIESVAQSGNSCTQVSDCCVVYWCDSCSTMQAWREMEIRSAHFMMNQQNSHINMPPMVVQRAVLVTQPHVQPFTHAPAYESPPVQQK